MILVDTSVWIDFFNRRPTPEAELLERLMGFADLAVADLVLVELLRGVRLEARVEQIRDGLSHLTPVTVGGEAVAIQAAQFYRSLRTRGTTIRSAIDCLIATYCIANGHTLLHSDRDFIPFERHFGLRVLYAG